MARSSSPDYKALFLKAEEERREAEQKQQEAEKQTRQTTFLELIEHCHNLFSRPLRARAPFRSTTGKIPPPTGKCCPLRLLPWIDCAARQQDIYHSVCNYLEPPGKAAERLFPPCLALESLGKEFTKGTISSKKDLEIYGRFSVENYVQRIITELCKIPAARAEFGLGDRVWFDNHDNALGSGDEGSHANESSDFYRSRPDQFCIHRVDGDTSTILITAEYNPPHKLSVENLRVGLRPMEFWTEIVQPDSVPTEVSEKLRYNATWLTGSAVVQEYHRHKARTKLPIWKTSFDYTRSQIPGSELQQHPPSSEYTSSDGAASEYLPSSSPIQSPTERRRIPPGDSSDSNTDPAPGGRKRGFSQVTSSPSSPSVQRPAGQTGSQSTQRDQHQHTDQFCTQRCLLGLQQGRELDNHYPNVKLHQQGGNSNHHLITTKYLVRQMKQQLDEDLDHNCTPMGGCGASGAPFKITCRAYRYTVVGKGTTSRLWKVVSREAVIYRILSRAQGSAVPVFLGAINLAMIYFLHRAGEIRHMLLMAWGGEPVHTIPDTEAVRSEISRSKKEIRFLGVLYQDLRPDNILWNAELGRTLIIDFHRCELDGRPAKKRMKSKKHSRGGEAGGQNQVHAVSQ
ncbi:hypothetical protein BDV28DRAFT_150844 [Aspergillus coremiiformis]|uniref:Protein kinase domain-containing protein n=1 Tax=Aspergillus coremiiformis TaxID=138285 RepID=A0A5N6YYQ3_9EURO|nr:hypothetical protein BDV28DRAFT_150844 [Aspergillus coremiiformis]